MNLNIERKKKDGRGRNSWNSTHRIIFRDGRPDRVNGVMVFSVSVKNTAYFQPTAQIIPEKIDLRNILVSHGAK